jgi:RHS repeat-associated protein
MSYDALGRMIALTDPDASSDWSPMKVHGIWIEKHDKTWVVFYDDIGRKQRILYPQTEYGRTDTKTITYNDAENSVTTVDPSGRKLYERYDWNGNLIELIAYGYEGITPSSEVQRYSYEYDELNRKVKFTDPKGIETGYTYDERNLLLEQDYGLTGSDLMEYNDLGQLVKKTDRKGQVLSFTYDEMGRNTSVKHFESEEDYLGNNPVRNVETVYDNRGNPVRIDNEHLIEYYIYDHSNRVISLKRFIKEEAIREQVVTVWGGDEANQVFAFSYTYNDAGMVTSMTYPDGSVHTFSYDGVLGRLEEIGEGVDEYNVEPFVTDFTYNLSGVVTRMDYANGTYQEWEFDNRKRISHIQVTAPSGVIEDLSYILNGSGDILSINDNEYEYDGFDRIVGAKTLLPEMTDYLKLVTDYFGTYEGGGPVDGISYNPDADLNGDGRVNGEDHMIASFVDTGETYDIESFEYDLNGNRTLLIQNGDEYSYEYGERNRLERIYLRKDGEFTRSLFAEYEYDGNGNTTKRTIYGEQETEVITFEYDTLNRLIRTTEGTEVTEYFYDNAGNRFIKKCSDGSLTLYLRHGQIAVAMDIEIPSDTTEVKGKVNRYVLSGDLLAGRITMTYFQDDTALKDKSWYHLDHLNSTKCVTDEVGDVEVSYVYRAFGEQLRKLGEGDAKYTYSGKELDEDTNLYYFNARYYDATIGRFINVDPVQDGSNWYVYAGNNPLRIVDPTGLAEIYGRVMVPDEGANDVEFAASLGLKHWFIRVNLDWTEQKAIFKFSEDGVGYYEPPHGKQEEFEIRYSGLDDDLTYKAAEMVIATGEWDAEDYTPLFHDCNTFVEAVFKKYEELWREQKLLENIDIEDFDIDEAWDKHYKEVTSRRGEIVKYDDPNFGDLPQEQETETD